MYLDDKDREKGLARLELYKAHRPYREGPEASGAEADYSEAIRLDPKYAWTYYTRGWAWGNEGEYDRAIADYNEAIRLDPKYASAYYNRGWAWGNKGEYDRAIADYNEAIRLDPKYASAYYNRGRAWNNKGEHDRAIADYNEAIRLDPKYAWTYNSRAWLWATCLDDRYRNGKRAVESATCACKLTKWKEVFPLGTLAAAYAESGDFDAAVKCQEKAQAMYLDDKDREKGLARLELYKAHRPYREQPRTAAAHHAK